MCMEFDAFLPESIINRFYTLFSFSLSSFSTPSSSSSSLIRIPSMYVCNCLWAIFSRELHRIHLFSVGVVVFSLPCSYFVSFWLWMIVAACDAFVWKVNRNIHMWADIVSVCIKACAIVCASVRSSIKQTPKWCPSQSAEERARERLIHTEEKTLNLVGLTMNVYKNRYMASGESQVAWSTTRWHEADECELVCVPKREKEKKIIERKNTIMISCYML